MLRVIHLEPNFVTGGAVSLGAQAMQEVCTDVTSCILARSSKTKVASCCDVRGRNDVGVSKSLSANANSVTSAAKSARRRLDQQPRGVH